MKHLRAIVIIGTLFLGFTSSIPATFEKYATTPRKPTKQDRCSVCGMFVSPHPQWLAQVIHEDGSVAFFDGAKDMFKYLQGREKYLPSKKHLPIVAAFVTDYYTTQIIPANDAHFVVGSDVNGPMGSEFVPLRTRVEAEEFSNDHGASSIISFEEVTPALLETL